jgi:zinc protease
MTILIHEDQDVPNVAFYLFYKIGSRNERPGTTGISHFFEHMMFNGAKKYGPKEFDIVMEKNGGRNNAYTSRDITAYTDWIPNTMLELMFEMEADRIADLGLVPKMIKSERAVVSNERRLVIDNSNFGALYEQLNATAYTAHPYQWPVIGWASDIETWTREDLENHYRVGYAPNNCVVVISGATTEAEVLRLAKKYFEPIPRQDPPPPVNTVEPEQRGERRVNLVKPAQLPVQMIAYHVPETTHPDYQVLDVMTTMLSSGQSSRLYKSLIDGDQLALQASCGVSQSVDPGQVICFLQPRSGVAIEKAEAALYAEIDKLKKAPPEARELEKAKNMLLTEYYQGFKSIANKANLIGRFEIYNGGWENLVNYPAAIEKITPEDIQRVAAKYFKSTNRTVATLIPESMAQEASEE